MELKKGVNKYNRSEAMLNFDLKQQIYSYIQQNYAPISDLKEAESGILLNTLVKELKPIMPLAFKYVLLNWLVQWNVRIDEVVYIGHTGRKLTVTSLRLKSIKEE